MERSGRDYDYVAYPRPSDDGRGTLDPGADGRDGNRCDVHSSCPQPQRDTDSSGTVPVWMAKGTSKAGCSVGVGGSAPNAKVAGMGRDGGYTAQVADACVIVPTVHAARVTPQVEAFSSGDLAPDGFASGPATGHTRWESIP